MHWACESRPYVLAESLIALRPDRPVTRGRQANPPPIPGRPYRRVRTRLSAGIRVVDTPGNDATWEWRNRIFIHWHSRRDCPLLPQGARSLSCFSRSPAWAQFDLCWLGAVDGDHCCLLEHDRHPACGSPFQVPFQVLIEASLAAVGGVHAADEHPVTCAQEVGYLFQSAPGQWRPCFLLAQQKDKRVGRVAGNGEPASARWSGQNIARRDSRADRAFDSSCHAAILA